MKKALLMFVATAFCPPGLSAHSFAQAPIENELYLITPVSKDVHDPVLTAFAAYAKKKWNVDVKTSAIPKGTPVAYGQILEWKGKPQADIFWGGEGTLFDDLAAEGLLEPDPAPPGDLGRDPGHHRQARRLPLKDPKKFWVGDHPGALRHHLPADASEAFGRGDQGLGRSSQPQIEGPDRPVHAGSVQLQPCQL